MTIWAIRAARATRLAAAALLLACGGGGGGGTPPFSDDFDAYTVQAWPTPLGGWESTNSKMWAISASGLTGNALWFTPNQNDTLLHPFDAQDYTVSVNVQHSLVPWQSEDYFTSLVGRATDQFSSYGCSIFTGSNHVTYLGLEKRWQEGGTTHAYQMASTQFFVGDASATAWYHLSLTFDGNVITARASAPAIPEVSLTVTDDASNGPVLTGTKVGVFGWAAVSFHPLYDDFLAVPK